MNQLAFPGAVLTREALRERLKDGSLVVAPILDEKQIGEGSINISLGTQFITNLRPQVDRIDPNELSEKKIRTFQKMTVVPFDKQFILHPGSFLLSATLEFISLPDDIAGFVLSRSGYGRTGLLIATATYIHPGWKGCLTLELENLGELPIALSPGLYVGQLVLLTAEKVIVPAMKSIPTGPVFSTLKENAKWAKLRSKPSEVAFVFQYGSNCSSARLNSASRLSGDASSLGLVTTVDNYVLSFSVWSNSNNCAAADIELGGSSPVIGVLYEVPKYLLSRETSGSRRSLDSIEGRAYERTDIRVRREDGTVVTACTYKVKSPRTGLRTSVEYLSHIVTGLREHNAPSDYVSCVKNRAKQNNPVIAAQIDAL
jgi:dCTP deaminase